MGKPIIEKRDLKSLTVFSLYSFIQHSKEQGNIGEDTNIIFTTSFGIVSASRIVSGPFKEEKLTNENYSRFAMQTTVSNTNKFLAANENEDILDTQSSIILEDVTIQNGNYTTNMPTMILFSEDILGLSFGS